ncbi:conserved hypothetical protein [Candidatus Accumulibacter aalborgensis]|uniref:DUF1840 domain-containing protein n=1 Tax=Candidatus Accumulibacter aalborgensis TaxID=1860102 RepID=A0A1A8XSX5_9PROT|nr:DUF1840 domain-containing protein [Candidatus Accumulibacter aalborgensis]SBT08185.1 conserved hypothetical protein [Candidatus Accumulibacter aalborgensis]
MLVKFTSSTSGQIMMFAPVARQLLDIVGKECTARGVITTEQLPEAIERLRLAAAAASSTPSPATEDATASEDSASEAESARVGLGQRAYPLIEILEWTRTEDGFVLWEAASDF